MSMKVTGLESTRKGKYRVWFDDGTKVVLYRGELRQLQIEEGAELSERQQEYMRKDILGKRAKKRAVYLLEKMDRTEAQIREKLLQGEYPKECIDIAVDYLKQRHFLDDYRYACNFIRYSGTKLSRQMIRQKLMQKGIKREVIEDALEEEYASEELLMIQNLLQKRNFNPSDKDERNFQRTYGFLARRGFRSSDILKAMKCENCTISSGSLQV